MEIDTTLRAVFAMIASTIGVLASNVVTDLSAAEVGVVLLVCAAGAIVQGSAGIGLGLVASPVLLAIEPSFAPGPLLVGGVVIGSRHMIAERPYLETSSLGRALIGLPVGAIGAVTVLQVMSQSALSLAIGVMICLSSALLLSGFQLRRSNTSDVVTGAAGTFTSMAAALPGPPLVIGFHDLSPGALRCTVSVFVTVVSVVAMVSLAVIGRFGTDEFMLLALMVPGLLLGLVASGWTRPRLDKAWFRPAVLVLSFLGGAVLAINQL